MSRAESAPEKPRNYQEPRLRCCEGKTALRFTAGQQQSVPLSSDPSPPRGSSGMSSSCICSVCFHRTRASDTTARLVKQQRRRWRRRKSTYKRGAKSCSVTQTSACAFSAASSPSHLSHFQVIYESSARRQRFLGIKIHQVFLFFFLER